MASSQRRKPTKAEKHPDLLGEFPLPHGHYFHPPVVAPRAHTGGWDDTESAAIRRLQQRLGVPESGVYDEQTAVAVQALGLPSGLVIDEEAWQALRHG